jgi:hydroxymethylpyrimidine pyrophosphatase-like HAD family hydrolase
MNRPQITEQTAEHARTLDLPGASTDTIASLTHTPEQLTELFHETDCVFADADGTLLDEGAVSVSPDYLAYIRDLAERGVTVVVVTGKPLAEVSKIYDHMPTDIPLQFLCEKGAYSVARRPGGGYDKTFVLSSEAEETAVAELRQQFFDQKVAEITESTRAGDGSQQVWFGLSGSGGHKSIFSLDIYGSEPPANYLEMLGTERAQFKLEDNELLARVEHELEDFVAGHHPDWRVVHMGNGNTEIAPGGVEKDMAIIRTAEFQDARIVQVWGDTVNDLAMFRLRQQHPDKVVAGLVIHREKAKNLLTEVDMVTFGMANTAPYFQLLLATHDA